MRYAAIELKPHTSTEIITRNHKPNETKGKETPQFSIFICNENIQLYVHLKFSECKILVKR
ncbi:hypothetical protein DOY81_003471 [Sarcophaga bullata]|nr:hypothetical protein DOY81_003471 [Sarcophaga bullata]